MTIQQWTHNAKQELLHANIATHQLDASLLLSHVISQTKTWLIAHGDEFISPAQLKQADELLQKRLQRVPIAYLTGHKEFYGREFIVTPEVLIPRPETEDLIEIAKELYAHHLPTTIYQLLPSSPHILDVGCGSGNIGLTLKCEQPDTNVTLSDISPAALSIAQQNTANLNADVTFVQSDLLEAFPTTSYQLPATALLIANLPYVNPDWDVSPELAHEPQMALYAEDNGLKLIKKLIDQAPQVLTVNGYLLLEADPEQHDAIANYSNQFVEIQRRNYAILLQLVI